MTRGKTAGVLGFAVGPSGRRYTLADLAFAEDLARRAAVALDNARLYQEAKEADRLKDEFLAMLRTSCATRWRRSGTPCI